MEEILEILFIIIIVILIIIVGSLAIVKGVEKHESLECQQWRIDKDTYPSWYALDWQIDQCKDYNIEL